MHNLRYKKVKRKGRQKIKESKKRKAKEETFNYTKLPVITLDPYLKVYKQITF